MATDEFNLRAGPDLVLELTDQLEENLTAVAGEVNLIHAALKVLKEEAEKQAALDRLRFDEPDLSSP